jgi:16S rRNA C967 or C1407 C5-methylase (RsmB/RsmF family)/NOL1/NOP2/fmu family ribosome biogenesis protein
MNWKPDFLSSLEGIKGFDKNAFIEAHTSNPPVSIRINPAKSFDVDHVFAESSILGKVPWCNHAFYLKSRPVFTLEPLLHAGAFYVQEASSMFVDHAIHAVFSGRKNLKALDLCAAPGGKTTLLASSPFFDTILANEIIQSRVGILMENLAKWGAHHVLVSNNDPEVVSRLGEQFDLVLVDAPCSGSGLFRKDEAAMKEWSAGAVELCAARQKRILQHAMSLVKEDGYLLYSTCSYSPSENEENADFILATGDFETIDLDPSEDWGIVETKSPAHHAFCYRFYPNLLSGEGFFCAMFRKVSGSNIEDSNTQHKIPAEASIVKDWLKKDVEELVFHMKESTLYLLNQSSLDCFFRWSSSLKIRKSGLKMGDIIRGELIPDHELSMSPILSENLSVIDLPRTDAIRYLRRDEITLSESGSGWQLVRYHGQSLGWAKIVNGRMKNHYPISWRILMSPF